MADSSKQELADENRRLAEEAKKAILTSIITAAPDATATGIEHLADAYALVIGAKWGHLPGVSSASTS
jgi:hypothetical protein